MDSINPIATSLMQSVELQRSRSADKQRAIRAAETLDDNVAERDDEMEHQVENTEEVLAIHDEAPEEKSRNKAKPNHKIEGESEEEGSAHIDLTA